MGTIERPVAQAVVAAADLADGLTLIRGRAYADTAVPRDAVQG